MKKLSETLTELGIAFSFPIEIKDANGKQTYCENSTGYWHRYEYDANGNDTYYENSKGFRVNRERDANSNDDWSKRGRDANGNQTYYENSDILGQVGA